jgi:hypothetical protein
MRDIRLTLDLPPGTISTKLQVIPAASVKPASFTLRLDASYRVHDKAYKNSTVATAQLPYASNVIGVSVVSTYAQGNFDGSGNSFNGEALAAAGSSCPAAGSGSSPPRRPTNHCHHHPPGSGECGEVHIRLPHRDVGCHQRPRRLGGSSPDLHDLRWLPAQPNLGCRSPAAAHPTFGWGFPELTRVPPDRRSRDGTGGIRWQPGPCP